LAARRLRPKGVIDTSVLVAGVAGFRSPPQTCNPSALLLHDWLSHGTFVWLVSEEILTEYKEVLRRLGVRRPLIGRIINLLREEAELVQPALAGGLSPDPADDPFCACAESGRASFISTLNPKHFPQAKLKAKVIRPGDPLPAARPRGRP
jgi:predicted nucleic acid-binding protein